MERSLRLKGDAMDGFDIGAARKREHITQKEMADAMNLTVPHIVAIERNNPLPPTPELVDMMLAAIDRIVTEKASAQ